MTNPKRAIIGSGVKRGYKPKQKLVKRREFDFVQQSVIILNQFAREALAFLTDEIVYATIDTLRVLRYLRAEFRRAPRKRVASRNYPVYEYELGYESGTLAAEPISTWSSEQRA